MSRNTTSVRTERSFNSFEGGQEKYFVDTMGCIAHHDVFYFIFFRPVDQSIPLYLIIFGIWRAPTEKFPLVIFLLRIWMKTLQFERDLRKCKFH